MNADIMTLIYMKEKDMPNGGIEQIEVKRKVFAERRSVGMREKYKAAVAGLEPELSFRLADYLDYQGEEYAEYQGRRYRIFRTYNPPDTTYLELVLVREVNKRT